MSKETAISEAADAAKEDISSAMSGVASGDIEALWPIIEKYIIPAASAILILIVGYFLSSFISRLISSPVKKRVDETLGKFIGKLVFYSLFTFTLLGVLGKFGISVSSFAAVIAAAGFAIGLAFQGTLSNFAAGVLLLVFRPFKVGDFIRAAGTEGIVSEIDLFTTALDTLQNEKIIIPNSQISSGKIENATFHPVKRVDVNVGVDYGADIPKTREALSQAVESLGELVNKQRGYQVYLLELGDNAVAWQVRVWASTAKYWDVREKATQAVKESLDAVGIGIPYPQLDLHVQTSEGIKELRTANQS